MVFPDNLTEILDSPCSNDLVDDDFKQALQEAIDNQDVILEHRIPDEESSQDKCTLSVERFLYYETCINIFGNCFDFTEVQSIPANEDFFAISTFYWEFWRFMEVSGSKIEMSKAKERIEEICSEDFASDDEKYGETDCFETTFIFQLLSQSYQIQVQKHNCKNRYHTGFFHP